MLKLLILLVYSPAYGSAPEFPYTLSRIEGAPTVEVIRNGKASAKSKGTVLMPGDILKVPSAATAELTNGDETSIILTGGSELEINSHEGVQSALRLRIGKLIGTVRSAAKKALQDDHGKKKYRVLIQSGTAVMGVRGTQFVVESRPEEKGTQSKFQVIEGQVDVGKDLASLLTDNFITVGAGQLVEAAGDGLGLLAQGTKVALTGVTDAVSDGISTISHAMPFDPVKFVSDANKALPPVLQIPFLTGNPPESNEKARFHLSSFEVGALGYFSRSGLPDNPSAIGIGISWNPTIHIKPDRWDLRFHIGNPRLFNFDDGLFGNLEFKVLGTYIWRKYAFIEAGPLYHVYPDASPGFGLNVNLGVWMGDKRVLRLIDRIYMGANWVNTGYRHYPQYSERVHAWEFRFGLGVTVF